MYYEYSDIETEYLKRKDKHRILPSAVLYGPNASGKSNVILALLTLQGIVDAGTVSARKSKVMSSLELFPFVHDGNKDPIAFEIEFVEGNEQFIYRLSIEVEPLKLNGKRCIVDEKLDLVLPKATATVFHRTKTGITVGNNRFMLGYLEKKNAVALQELVNNVIHNIDEEALFLTGGFRSTIRKAVADKVIGYITKKILPIVNLSEVFLDSAVILSNERLQSGSNMISVQWFDDIIKAADFGPQKIGWREKDNDTGKQDLHELEMVSIYLGSLIPSNLMESAGTVRLLRFSILLREFMLNGGILLIDEMDNAIHPEITKAIIAMFGNQTMNKNGAQLVFTTHNPVYMDRELLRRDQILFTERDPDSFESTLHSLGDFGSVNVRNDQSFMRNYFKGRYGRLPYVDLETILTKGMEG